jgi:hypothetical protein
MASVLRVLGRKAWALQLPQGQSIRRWILRIQCGFASPTLVIPKKTCDLRFSRDFLMRRSESMTQDRDGKSNGVDLPT